MFNTQIILKIWKLNFEIVTNENNFNMYTYILWYIFSLPHALTLYYYTSHPCYIQYNHATLHLTTWHHATLHLTPCHRTPPHLTPCHPTSPHLTPCHHTPPKSDTMPPYTSSPDTMPHYTFPYLQPPILTPT